MYAGTAGEIATLFSALNQYPKHLMLLMVDLRERTPYLLTASQTLSQLSYRPMTTTYQFTKSEQNSKSPDPLLGVPRIHQRTVPAVLAVFARYEHNVHQPPDTETAQAAQLHPARLITGYINRIGAAPAEENGQQQRNVPAFRKRGGGFFKTASDPPVSASGP